MEEKKQEAQKADDFSTENVLALLDIYMTEWCYRDEILWKQVYTLFYATLVVLFLPNLTAFTGLQLPQFPTIFFPAVALIMSVVFLIISIGYTKRLAAIGDTIMKVLEILPSNVRRLKTEDVVKTEIEKKLYTKRLSVTLCVLMFGSLFAMSVVMILFYLGVFPASPTP